MSLRLKTTAHVYRFLVYPYFVGIIASFDLSPTYNFYPDTLSKIFPLSSNYNTEAIKWDQSLGYILTFHLYLYLPQPNSRCWTILSVN